MLETVDAVRYSGEMDGGRNRPWLIEAERENGQTVEIVAKLGKSECGWGGLVREAFSAMLAADLGLPVPEPFVVTLTDDFVATLPRQELKDRCVGQKTCFGSHFYPNLMSVNPKNLPSHLLSTATRTFSFDAGVLNADRLVTKPNCLTDGAKLLLIDHELSLNVHGLGFLVQQPWTEGALDRMKVAPSKHLFFEQLKAKTSVDTNFYNKLAAIPESRIVEYGLAIPEEWDADEIADGIRHFLVELVKNAPGLNEQVKAVCT